MFCLKTCLQDINVGINIFNSVKVLSNSVQMIRANHEKVLLLSNRCCLIRFIIWVNCICTYVYYTTATFYN